MQTNNSAVGTICAMNKQESIQEIGLIIKRYREDNYPTQEELSFRTNIHRNQISLIERGVCDLKTSTLLVICKVLDIPLNEFEVIKNVLEIENTL